MELEWKDKLESNYNRKRKTKTISLPPELLQIAEEYCKKTGITFSELVRQALTQKLDFLLQKETKNRKE